MKASEILDLISKQWCDFNDFMKISQLGETNSCRLRKKIREDLEDNGYILPKKLLPMLEVVKYLKIDVNYLEERARKEQYEINSNVK